MNRGLGTLMGILAGLLIPLLVLVGRGMSGRWGWWVRWIENELSRQTVLYVVLTLGGVFILGLLGFWIGLRWEEMEEETTQMGDFNSELSFRAATDPLTELFNKRSLEERLTVELENAHRTPLSCIMIDIDHFKRINDTHGHPFGDQVLIKVGGIIKASVRRMDAVARLGGEEFMVLLPGVSIKEASLAAERIRTAIETEEFWNEDHRVLVTVSLGVFTKEARDSASIEDFFKSADRALYRAKKSGRNQTAIFGTGS